MYRPYAMSYTKTLIEPNHHCLIFAKITYYFGQEETLDTNSTGKLKLYLYIIMYVMILIASNM